MNDENERSVASDGSVAGKPVAWALQHKNGDMRIGMYFNPADAYEYAEACGDTVVPLYRHPQPTLTDAERDVIEWCQQSCSNVRTPQGNRLAATLRSLLERTK